jgi:hypothetical protein
MLSFEGMSMQEVTMAAWEHCKMVDNRLNYLGAGLLENRVDRHATERGAWDQIRDEGWELVSVVVDPANGALIHYFKRPRAAEKS